MNATDRHVAYHHLPVMRDEIVAAFATIPAGTIVDATLGGGGHAAAILASRDDLSVLGVARDQAALDAAAAHLAPFGDRVAFSHRRFDQLDQLDQVGAAPISGVLFDLGVSSPQLDRAERGFSYQHEGPLDMRMDASAPHSADDVVNTYEERTLAQVLRQYGDERFARRIAAAIVAARPVATTTELAGIITAAIPAPARRHGGHPAKRSFQAIRIEVNDELAALPIAIDQAIAITAPGGRMAVLTYHSGEDRIVKERFREASGACSCPPGLPCRCGAVALVRFVRGIPRSPSDAEVVRNRRAASARLRVVERLDTSDLDHDRQRDASDDRPTHERGAS
ncbi:16S rRNA (cytosine(1402)-N(4))-methyltransferase RsmH [soil metagenome]